MSLFSQFDALGYIGASGGTSPRNRLLLASSAPSNAYYSTTFGFEIKDNPRYIVYRDDLALNTGSGIPLYYHYIDTLTGQVRITGNSQKVLGTANFVAQWINPINGGIMVSGSAGFSNTNVYQSTDFGATFTDLGFGDGGASSWSDSEHMGGWYDGTNFIFGYGGGLCWYTTNGTSFSAQSPAFEYTPLPGNNYSSYSGRYFHHSPGSGYKYRTSRTGSDTLVSGYSLTAMSRNGRYMMRVDSTPTALQYSTDGGSSWSTFSNTPYLMTTYPNYLVQQSTCLATDSGDFWITSKNMNMFKYSFSESRWISYGGLLAPPFFGTRAVRFGGSADAESFIIRQYSSVANRTYYALLADFPTAT